MVLFSLSMLLILGEFFQMISKAIVFDSDVGSCSLYQSTCVYVLMSMKSLQI